MYISISSLWCCGQALSSATQHAMPPEFGRKQGTECLNTRFPLPTPLCAGYSVKLIYLIYFDFKIYEKVNIKSVPYSTIYLFNKNKIYINFSARTYHLKGKQMILAIYILYIYMYVCVSQSKRNLYYEPVLHLAEIHACVAIG